MALVGNDLYVAERDALLRFPYQPGATRSRAPADEGRRSARRAAQPSLDEELIASRDGSQALRDRRLEQQRRRERHRQGGRAARRSGRSIRKTGAHRVFASGLRNPNGLAWEPQTRRAVDGGQRARRARQRPRARLPDVGDGRRLLRLAVQLLRPARRRAREAAAARPRRQGDRARLRARRAHGVARARVLARCYACPTRYRNGMFVGQHGSWNRKPRSGYKVIFVPFADGKPSGPPMPVLTGFVDRGRRRVRAAGRRRDRQARRAARRRRRRQHGLARDQCRCAAFGGNAIALKARAFGRSSRMLRRFPPVYPRNRKTR